MIRKEIVYWVLFEKYKRLQFLIKNFRTETKKMFWIATILAASLLGSFGIKAQGSISNYTDLEIKPDGEWNQFNFGLVGQPPFVMLKFVIGLMDAIEDGDIVHTQNHGGGGNNPEGPRHHHDHGMRKCYLEITDAFCPGDRFELIKLGTGGLAPTTLLQTPVVPFNPIIAREICDGFPVQCGKSTSNPEVAFNDPTWSSGRVLLSSGEYSVVVKSIASPYCSGAGFVRIRCSGHPMPPPPPPPPPPHPEVLCRFSEGGFHMVMKPVQGPMAGSVCEGLGMKLAEINNANFVPSTNVAFKCSGPLSTSWIGAWNGQTWAGQEGLGLTVSTTSPGGSINVYNDGKARNVLCQEL